MTYSYDRNGAKTAGRNGEVAIQGGERGGVVYFRRKVTMPPSFDGAYLDKTIQNLGWHGLESILDAGIGALVRKGRPSFNYKFLKASAGMDRGDFFLEAQAKWDVRRRDGGSSQDVVDALKAVSGPHGFTLTEL